MRREIRIVRQFSFGLKEVFFMVGFCAVFFCLRFTDITTVLGQLVLEMNLNP